MTGTPKAAGGTGLFPGRQPGRRDGEPIAGAWESLFERSPFGVLVFEPSDPASRGDEHPPRLLRANQRAAELHGISESDLPSLLARLAGDGALAVLFGAGLGASYDYRWPVVGRGRRWIRATTVPLGPSDGQGEATTAAALWLQDVTEEREREATLAHEAELMAEAQRLTRIGNWEWNLNSGTCSWSEELYRIHGRDPASYTPTPVNEACLKPGEAERLRELLDACIRSGEPSTFEHCVVRPSGEERVLETHLRLARDDQGEPAALIGAANDVTRDKLIQAELSDEKQKAVRASRAKTEFMANMSHELRTPLNAIIGFSEVMRREMFGPLGDPRYLEYTVSIHESGSHLLQLINDILDLSKVEAGKYRLHEEIIPLREEIEQCLATFVVSLEAKGLLLVRNLPEGLPRLMADRRVVRQVLLNLLSNAVKFTRSGNITVSVAVDESLSMTVADTGIGMGPRELEQAMEPFEQIERSATLSGEGTGIGLPLTKRLLEAHGGDLLLSSVPGVGTSATACFPSYRVVPESSEA